VEWTRFLLKQEFRKRRNWVNLPFLRSSSHLSGVEERFSRYQSSQILGFSDTGAGDLDFADWGRADGRASLPVAITRKFWASAGPVGGKGVPARTAGLSFDIKPGFFSPNQIPRSRSPNGTPRRKWCPMRGMERRLFSLDDRSSHVGAAVRTDDMRQSHLSTLRTWLKLFCLQGVVGSTLAATRIGMFSFRDSHGIRVQ